MNRRSISLFLICFVLAACNDKSPDMAPGDRYNIDKKRLTVSGVSAGAYMAGQYHLAHAADVSGAGFIAGGPYACAQGNVSQALGPCMKGGGIDVAALLAFAEAQSEQGSIDPQQHLSGDRVWIFHGANDAIVHADVSVALAEFYRQFAPQVEVATVTNIAAPHGMPTIASDANCDDVLPPFLNNCDFDAAGALLRSVGAVTTPREATANGQLVVVSQPGAAAAGMLDEALLFVPDSCAAGELCGVHVAFHGCQQSSEFVGRDFATGSGYNEWASNNHLLVVYPQVASSSIAPVNPLGCWDWWGYTGADYATRDGKQVAATRALLESLSGAAN